jgi:hypothetical protein
LSENDPAGGNFGRMFEVKAEIKQSGCFPV